MSKKKSSNLIILLASTVIVLLLVLTFSRFTDKTSRVSFSCGNPDLSYVYDENEKTAIFEGNEIPVPKLAEEKNITNVLGVSQGERWVEIDLSEQKLKAWEGSNLFLETSVSSGLPWTPTPTGEFTIQYKSRAQKMEGGSGKYYYYLPNVPYVMFFGNPSIPWSKGYSLHGTYWHSDFGTRRSHGCVNLPTPVAEKLYYWTAPQVSEGKGIARVDNPNQGTKVVIHD